MKFLKIIQNRKLHLVLFMTSIAISLVFFISTASSIPTDEMEDPLVTKGYVDKVLTNLDQKVEDIFKKMTQMDLKLEEQSKLTKENREEISSVENKWQGTGTGVNVSLPKFEIVQAKKNQSVLGGESTEMILRAGSARVIASKQGGILDITYTGGDLKHRDKVQLNHLLIIPRKDGRGLKITSREAWLMIRGEYEIK